MSNPSFPSFFLPQDITRQSRLPREQTKGWHQKQLSSLDSLDRNSLISSEAQRNIWLAVIFSSTMGNRKREGESSERERYRLFCCLFNFALYRHLFNCGEEFFRVRHIKEMPNMVNTNQTFTKCWQDIAHTEKTPTSWQSHEYLS